MGNMRSTGNESNFRTSAYEALASYVTHASPTSITAVQNTALQVLSRMEQLLGMQVGVTCINYCVYELVNPGTLEPIVGY